VSKWKKTAKKPPLFSFQRTINDDNFQLAKDKIREATFSNLANYLIVTVKIEAPSRFKTHAAIIKTLAHPTRLFILDELSRAERCVRDLTDMIGVEMPTVSRHLSLLKSAGILEDEKRGAQVFYRVRVPCVLEVFACVKAIENNRRAKTKPPCQTPPKPQMVPPSQPQRSKRNNNEQE
jgi:ArsR family transcriptional regulator